VNIHYVGNPILSSCYQDMPPVFYNYETPTFKEWRHILSPTHVVINAGLRCGAANPKNGVGAISAMWTLIYIHLHTQAYNYHA